MTLFESATELQVRLEAANTAHAGDERLSRGRTVRDNIALAAEYFEAVQAYRVSICRCRVGRRRCAGGGAGSSAGAARLSGPIRHYWVQKRSAKPSDASERPCPAADPRRFSSSRQPHC